MASSLVPNSLGTMTKGQSQHGSHKVPIPPMMVIARNSMDKPNPKHVWVQIRKRMPYMAPATPAKKEDMTKASTL